MIFIPHNSIHIFNGKVSSPLLKLALIYPVLQNNLNLAENIELTQIDQFGRPLSNSFCPNNPKVQDLIQHDFESLSEMSHIAGIQLSNLEMPLEMSQIGCFCPYCIALAEEKGLNLSHIARILQKKAHNGMNARWIKNRFPDWITFRMKALSNLSGRLMVLIRKINPALFLGLNVNFTKDPEYLGQDYFFLALFLDLLTFIVKENMVLKYPKLLKQIHSITKTFLGDFRIFLQIKVPNEFNKTHLLKLLRHSKKIPLHGLVFEAPHLKEITQLALI
ncbi:MAG: hypothetical protein ACTSRS_00570 [Candidatus Helarchaeota archaeon]